MLIDSINVLYKVVQNYAKIQGYLHQELHKKPMGLPFQHSRESVFNRFSRNLFNSCAHILNPYPMILQTLKEGFVIATHNLN
jgi:hypothetical protein